MIRRFLLSLALLVVPLWAHGDWAADRDGSAGYVTVTTLATAVDEAVPFVVVYLSDLPADFHTAMSDASDTDGKTIRVSTSDGTTQLACVPIGVNTSTDTGCLIFLGTGMSASVDVDYRIYVGNASLSMPTASGGMGEQAVFADYAGVYFPGVDTRDWTSGGRDLTATDSPGTTASGYEGILAATYNGTSQYHSYEGTQAISAWPLTLEALAYTTSATTNQRAFNLSVSTSMTSSAATQFGGGYANDPYRGVIIGNGGNAAVPGINNYTTSAWHFVAVSRDANTGTTAAYINSSSATNSTTVNTPTAFNRLSIGSGIYTLGSVERLTGNVAVALLSSSVRSADFIATSKRNWDGTLYSAGAWTANDSDVVAGSTGWVLFQAAGQSVSADEDWIDTSNVLIDDATYAYCTVDDSFTTTEYLNLTNPAYGVTIPVGAPSYTVEYRIKRYRTGGAHDEAYDVTVQMIDETGARVGDNLAALGTEWTNLATTADYMVTGKTIDGGDFDADTGLSIRTDGSQANGFMDVRIVTAWIKVSWTGTDTTANTRGFFALTE